MLVRDVLPEVRVGAVALAISRHRVPFAAAATVKQLGSARNASPLHQCPADWDQTFEGSGEPAIEALSRFDIAAIIEAAHLFAASMRTIAERIRERSSCGGLRDLERGVGHVILTGVVEPTREDRDRLHCEEARLALPRE